MDAKKAKPENAKHSPLSSDNLAVHHMRKKKDKVASTRIRSELNQPRNNC